jgi:hypothetical protein
LMVARPDETGSDAIILDGSGQGCRGMTFSTASPRTPDFVHSCFEGHFDLTNLSDRAEVRTNRPKLSERFP